jgi:hypothetical protein
MSVALLTSDLTQIAAIADDLILLSPTLLLISP